MKQPKGFSFYAARYYHGGGTDRTAYNVVLYEMDIDPDECPHDWCFTFSKGEWRKMGGLVPPLDGHVEIQLLVRREQK